MFVACSWRVVEILIVYQIAVQDCWKVTEMSCVLKSKIFVTNSHTNSRLSTLINCHVTLV